MSCAQNPGAALGTRKDRETRIGNDHGLFLCVMKNAKKKPDGINAAG
jgi:hypothetical protein